MSRVKSMQFLPQGREVTAAGAATAEELPADAAQDTLIMRKESDISGKCPSDVMA
ncbi:hypothetical protein GCM10023160_14160 [Brachybacterium paraconglomeratum]